MKLKISILCLLVSSWFGLSSFKHPIKLTASLIEYNDATKNMRMECKVFIDDFENSINKMLTKDLDVYNLTKEDTLVIEDYFKQHYSINISGKRVPLKLKATEVQESYNILVLKFGDTPVSIKKGDKIIIENILFFMEFGESQDNRVTLRVPPFLKEKNFQSSINKYSFNHTF